jgi:hypothetical protein
MPPAALKALFADIRAAPDEALLAALAAAARAPRASDPLVSEVTALLAPILARSAEKAQMLVAHLNGLVGRELAVRPAGLAATVRALRRHLSDEDIRDGAYGLRVTLQRDHSLREKVK